jgi:predicted enzyme related to lactoylglutathione lyase
LVPDAQRSVEFYSRLLGWKKENSEEFSGGRYYHFMSLQGRILAGIGDADPNDHAAPDWRMYITTDDGPAAVDRVVANGGVAVEVIDAGYGYEALCTDPLGARFAVFQPKTNPGALIFREPGTARVWDYFAPNEMLDQVRSFYEEVCKLTRSEIEFLPNIKRDALGADGEAFAVFIGSEETAPGWFIHFQVESCDEATRLAEELGAEVTQEPMKLDTCAFSSLLDPSGVRLRLIEVFEPTYSELARQ